MVVDFAHTPQALEKALDTVRELTTGRLLLAFGLAGGRDFANRPVMGALAAHKADFFAITQDDPGDEDTAAIAEQIADGRAFGWRIAKAAASPSSSIDAQRFGSCSSAPNQATRCCWRAKATSSAWLSATSAVRGMTRG